MLARDLTEFERQTIRQWALADARAIAIEAEEHALQVAHFCDGEYWFPFRSNEAFAFNIWGHA